MGLKASVIDEEEFGLMMSNLRVLVGLVFDMACVLLETLLLRSCNTATV